MKPGELHTVYQLVVADDLPWFWDPEDPELFTWVLYFEPVMLIFCYEVDDDRFWRVMTAKGLGWCREKSMKASILQTIQLRKR